MSGVVKGVKKVFKAVGKVAKKVLPFALPIAAAVFTVGGALGIPAMAGGWAGAVGKLTGNGLLGKVIGGAVTQAGYMGLAGGAVGGITGGTKGLKKGLGYGQIAGAAIGGIGGAIGYAGNPQARAATGSSQASTAGIGSPGNEGLARSTATMRGYGDALPGQVSGTGYSTQGFTPASIGQSNIQAAQGVTSAAQQLPSSGMVPGVGYAAPAATGFKSLDPIVQASLITSMGAALPQAIGALTSKRGDDNPQLAVEEERRKAIAQNYAGIRMPTTPSLSQPPRQIARYEYDPSQGRVVLRYA